MHFKIDGDLLVKVEKITSSDYGCIDNLIKPETVEIIIDELIYEIERLEKQIVEIEQDRDDNYKPLSIAEQYGISNKDFL